jgi:hypothetical protein
MHRTTMPSSAEGDIASLHLATVFGLFISRGQSGSHGIDIEAALWGRKEPNVHNLAYTVYPSDIKDAQKNVLKESVRTHR